MQGLELLIDLHLGNDRQGPGEETETRRALELTGIDPKRTLRVADVGCGTGASTLVLARRLNARVTAIDAAPAFIERLRVRAADAGVADRVNAQVGRMEALPFTEHELDLIWSESAIYNMGFAEGLRAWRPFLRPGGVLAVSELTWTTARRPAGVERHWGVEYPGITTASANLRKLEDEGYRPLGMFFLPTSSWTNYYDSLRAALPAFLERHPRNDAAQAIAQAEQTEMRLHRDFGAWYGYAFYIAAVLEA